MFSARAAALGALAALAVSVFGAGQAFAQDDMAEPNGPDWAFGHPAGEAVLTGVAALSLTAFLLPQQTSGWAPSSHQRPNEVADEVSDFTGHGFGAVSQMAAGYALEVHYYELHKVGEPYGRAVRTTLADIESLMAVMGLTEALKRVSGRCRPRAWTVELDRCDPAHPEVDAFPSGHTSAVAAVAGARLAFAVRSQGRAAPRFLAFGSAETATVVTGLLRMMAGAHSWEDVAGAWALGHAVGGLVSLAHPMRAVADGTGAHPLGRSPTAMVVLGGRF